MSNDHDELIYRMLHAFAELHVYEELERTAAEIVKIHYTSSIVNEQSS